MFSKLKVKIKELAKTAVKLAEEKLGSNKGKEKKEMAINFVVSNIPVPAPFKPAVKLFLSAFIDEAIEFAVEYMNKEVL
ncbi:MAG: hypothetical protein BHW55_03370 [Candidatus Melainabacteria bacterium 35_41]|jgi:hypothetical protein|nr:MAG: hypothetical protein BHW55_03370 [Candidatus Melainabacteria bacterium 35_41]DAU65112.1 MAG TPA: holin [Caudoviricetes sp.]